MFSACIINSHILDALVGFILILTYVCLYSILKLYVVRIDLLNLFEIDVRYRKTIMLQKVKAEESTITS